MRILPAFVLGILLAATSATAQVASFRCGRWSATPGQPVTWFAVIQWSEPWRHRDAAVFAASLGARLAALPSASSLENATLLSADPVFWECAGPWIGAVREPSAPWTWPDGSAVDPAAWATSRPGQAWILPACMLLAGEGGPTGRITDALDTDFGQPRTSSAILEWVVSSDCNANLVPDALEMAFDPTLDSDRDGQIDTCAERSPDVDANGVVDFGDIALVLLDFGPCAGCATDVDQNGVVDFGDVALVLLNFGP